MDAVEPEIIKDKSKLSKEEREELWQLGIKKILFGKVALIILAGTDGSKIGSDKPKGCFDIGLPSKKSLFQLIIDRFVRV